MHVLCDPCDVWYHYVHPMGCVVVLLPLKLGNGERQSHLHANANMQCNASTTSVQDNRQLGLAAKRHRFYMKNLGFLFICKPAESTTYKASLL